MAAGAKEDLQAKDDRTLLHIAAGVWHGGVVAAMLAVVGYWVQSVRKEGRKEGSGRGVDGGRHQGGPAGQRRLVAPAHRRRGPGTLGWPMRCWRPAQKWTFRAKTVL